MKKIKVTQQQRDNLLDALHVMWPSVPPENVAQGLVYWRSDNPRRKPDCGTICCLGGWCAIWPAFRAQGVFASTEGSPRTRSKNNSMAVAEALFGCRDMFRARGVHPADRDWAIGDHAVVTDRLQWLLDNSEVAA